MTSWCSTCGRATPFGVEECKSCARWWEDNPLNPEPEDGEIQEIDEANRAQHWSERLQ